MNWFPVTYILANLITNSIHAWLTKDLGRQVSTYHNPKTGCCGHMFLRLISLRKQLWITTENFLTATWVWNTMKRTQFWNKSASKVYSENMLRPAHISDVIMHFGWYLPLWRRLFSRRRWSLTGKCHIFYCSLDNQQIIAGVTNTHHY